MGRIQPSDQAQRGRGQDKDLDPRALVIHAARLGESFPLLGGHAQDTPEALAVHEPEQDQRSDEDHQGNVIGGVALNCR